MSEFIYESLDDITQFKIYNNVVERIEEMEQIKKFNPIVSLMKIIDEETHSALSENAKECDCGCPSEQQEWQEFDKVFICPECGENN